MSKPTTTFLVVMIMVAMGCSRSTGPKQSPGLSALVHFDNAQCLSREVVTMNLRLDPRGPGNPMIDSVSGLDFRVCYDLDKLDFIDPPAQGPGISEWEHFACSTGVASPCGGCKLGIIRLIATRDLDNHGLQSLSQPAVRGTIASLQFQTTRSFKAGDSLEIGFCLLNWSDNSISQMGNQNNLFIPDTTLGRIEFVAGYDTSQSSHVYKLRPVLELQSGWIHLKDPIYESKGDVDLNGIPFQVHDAVVFGNFFSQGYAAFDPQRASEQIAQTDVNKDGEPLTQADFAEMVRVIGGGNPGGDTAAIPYQDTLWVLPWFDGTRQFISCKSTAQVDELWLSILGPAPVGTVHYLGVPPAVVSSSLMNGSLRVSCGTVGGVPIFGPELGTRFEIQGYNGHWLAIEGQASRYPGVAMVVIVGPLAFPGPPPHDSGP